MEYVGLPNEFSIPNSFIDRSIWCDLHRKKILLGVCLQGQQHTCYGGKTSFLCAIFVHTSAHWLIIFHSNLYQRPHSHNRFGQCIYAFSFTLCPVSGIIRNGTHKIKVMFPIYGFRLAKYFLFTELRSQCFQFTIFS